MTLDHVFEKKGDIEEAVSTGLRTKINKYGYDIDGSPVTDIQPDEKVRSAMNEIKRQAACARPPNSRAKRSASKP